MSIDQRKFIGDVTLWLLRATMAIGAFFAISIFNEVRNDIHEMKAEVTNVRERVIRLETKLEK